MERNRRYTMLIIFLLVTPSVDSSIMPETEETGGFQFHTEQILRQNYGIIFQKQPQILLNGYSEFKLYFRIPRIRIPNFPELDRELKCWVKHDNDEKVENVCEQLQVLQNVYLESYKTLVEEAKYMNNALNIQLSEPISTKQAARMTRALFGIVGKLSRGLFGTATIDDVREIYTHVRDLENYVERNQNDESEIKEALVSFANLTNERFNFAKANIRDNFDNIKNNRKALEIWQYNLESLSNNFSTFSQNVNGIMDTTVDFLGNYIANIQSLQVFTRMQHNYMSGIEVLQKGKLSHSLVRPQEFKRALSKVNKQLKNKHPNYKLVHKDLSFYYNHHLTLYTYTKEDVYVFISIPIENQETEFYLYKVLVLPVPIQTSTNAESGYTKISLDAEMLAIDRSKHYYIELNSNDLVGCDKERIIQCPQVFFRRERTTVSCLTALFFDIPDEIKHQCEVLIYPDSTKLKPFLLPMSDSKYLLSTAKDSYQTICEQNLLEEHTACKLCVVNILCGCKVILGEYESYAPLNDCADKLEVHETGHTLNMAVVTEFDFPRNTLTGSSFLNKSVTLKLPKILDSMKSFSDISEKDRETGLKLKKVAEAIRTQRKTYYQPHTGKDSTLITLPWDDTASSRVLWLIVCSAISVVNFVLVIIMFLKINRIAAIMSVVQNKISAAEVKPYVLLPNAKTILENDIVTSNEESVESFDTYYYVMALLAALGCLFAVIKFIYFLGYLGIRFPKIQEYCRKTFSPAQRVNNLRLYLKIVSKDKRCLLYLFSLEYEPNLIAFSIAPRVIRARMMQRRMESWIQMQWGGPLKLMINDNVTDIKLPEHVKLPGYRTGNVREIINSPEARFHLLFHYYNEEQYIQIPERSRDILNPPIHHSLPIKSSPPRCVYYTPNTSPMARPSPYQQALGQLQRSHNDNETTNDSSPDRPSPVAQPSAPDEFAQGSPPRVQRLVLGKMGKN